ncbi:MULTISPECIES: MATE family efflux transporter [unclassified Methanosarcina]|uniref:MATE family efflux transporter n=1 Tax=unclassified Methanosarcina TaxID=2644672 RepID=UPI000615583A|nr:MULTISPECIES: MATE family efflux transporter [unclassified Methanosarcina]AKB18595.1 Multi antimicrobial extrusion protein (Na(+)/drug antiporter), MATE family of MDR efflux pumps [Methanosarcina sp. WWM596]AKB21847.1 Multi antimicrobial extrusion protein (Na(+)/drug antiporter), MATE family of MDR efflux pumps [Methanosarcina sp. WH1]
MVSDEEMRSGNILSLFLKFAFPAVVGVIVAGIQEIIDGFFIGNAVGSQGLAGITLIYPPYLVIIGVGIIIGIGSSSLTALELGKGNTKGALDIVNNAFPLCILAGAFFTIGGLIFCKTSISLLGASGIALSLAREYLQIIFLGSVFIILNIALDPLVRNDGKPKLCMNIMIAGIVVNVVLDYLFVMRMGMGMSGAAIATVTAFALSALMLIYYLFGSEAKLKLRVKSMRFKIRILFQILRTGLPSFVMQISLALVLFVHNYMLLIYGSELAVSAYGIIGFVFSIFYMLFEGIALGVQPIIGFNYGAGYYERVSKTLKLTMFSCILIGALGFLLIYFFSENLVQIFNRDDSELLAITLRGMNICMVSLLVEGTVLLTAIYYQSINRVRAALFIHLGKIFIFLFPLLFILPRFFGLDGVWSAGPATEYIMMVVVLVMLSKEFEFLRNNGKPGTGQPKDTKHVVSVSRNNVKAGSEESKGFVTFRQVDKVKTS